MAAGRVPKRRPHDRGEALWRVDVADLGREPGRGRDRARRPAHFPGAPLLARKPSQPGWAAGGGEAVTPEKYRYADAVPAPGGGLIAVREDHTDPAHVKNAIVRVPQRG